jgi:hypothetical protein
MHFLGHLIVLLLERMGIPFSTIAIVLGSLCIFGVLIPDKKK